MCRHTQHSFFLIPYVCVFVHIMADKNGLLRAQCVLQSTMWLLILPLVLSVSVGTMEYVEEIGSESKCNPTGDCFNRTVYRPDSLLCEECWRYCFRSISDCHCNFTWFVAECMPSSTTTERTMTTTPTPHDNSLSFGPLDWLAVFAVVLSAGLIVGLIIFWRKYRNRKRTPCRRRTRYRMRALMETFLHCRKTQEEKVLNQVAGAEDHRDAESIVARNGSVSGAQDQPDEIKTIQEILIHDDNNLGDSVVVAFKVSASGRCDGYRIELHTGENFSVSYGNPIYVFPQLEVADYSKELTGLYHGQLYQVTVIPLIQGRDGMALKKDFYTRPLPPTDLTATPHGPTSLVVKFTYPRSYCQKCVVRVGNEEIDDLQCNPGSGRSVTFDDLNPSTSYDISIRSVIQGQTAALESKVIKFRFERPATSDDHNESTDDYPLRSSTEVANDTACNGSLEQLASINWQ